MYFSKVCSNSILPVHGVVVLCTYLFNLFPYFFVLDGAWLLFAPLAKFPFLFAAVAVLAAAAAALLAAAFPTAFAALPALEPPAPVPVPRFAVPVAADPLAPLLPVLVRPFLVWDVDRDFFARLRSPDPVALVPEPRTAAAAASRCFCCCARSSF